MNKNSKPNQIELTQDKKDDKKKEGVSLKRIRPEVESIPMTSIQWNRTAPF
ncbi:hypothetical protein SAMN04487831_12219 [Pseudobutyrivibrio sp. UC1225]|uniref:hypothetical protein n=1 Tax=Pseudobutyrivibrio sp. UC1225 TaxID=1798185 RepID=UPI0008E0C6BC|nr:hypothetical protein [Pseudobutyrivibrio sp. UC1225]SFO34232.1 hypothetical protein SAMN04487831_12219 [Pseudobutyrivibrio sp. UC1225]